MKQQEYTKEEARGFIIRYIEELDTGTLTAKDHKRLEKHFLEDADVVEELLREDIITGGTFSKSRFRKGVITRLFQQGRCGDYALAEARELVEGLRFIDKNGREYLRSVGVRYMPEWTAEDEAHLRKWLMCECDDMPENVPLTEIIQKINYCGDPEEMHFAAMSKVCDFPLRYCAYTMFRGVLMEFKWPMRGLILYREEGFADNVFETIKEMYSMLFGMTREEIDACVMLCFAGVYCSGEKKKAETLFYQKYIDKWMTEDRERFLGYIREKMNTDFRSKVLKKLAKQYP